MQETAEAALAARLSPYLRDPGLLHLALAHRSWCAEHPGEESNERLEFLGDAVLGVVVTEHLYRALSARAEGDMARIRSGVVSTEALAPVAAALGVGEALLLGRGEESSGGRAKASLLADALEALIGAAYLASGAAAAEAMVGDLLGDLVLAETARRELGDAKNRLQELAARLSLPTPAYETTGRGPDHARSFRSVVTVGEHLGEGEGRSKKLAERLAAEALLVRLAAPGRGAAGPPRA
ncbi:MAG TPA: ribonuclease III [Acidimicrobiales bacterium]|nr:ribonuclease III [Acidimicrobiales bacterium]